jgi:predicted DsbA family dithiol-disulfide isomerase
MVPLFIFSDPICPWCFIGKARLFQALEQRPDHPFQIEWHPFMLNPDMPPEGMDRRTYFEAKFGGKEGAARAFLPVQQAAEATGLTIDFDRMARTPSTLDAHRLIHWAGIEGRQTPVVSSLFKAYFSEGRDIGDPDVLADIGAASGMERDLVARLLASDADAADIRARDTDARQKGVNAVPTFVVASRHVVPGAQPVELWLKVIDEIAAQIDTAHKPADRPAS